MGVLSEIDLARAESAPMDYSVLPLPPEKPEQEIPATETVTDDVVDSSDGQTAAADLSAAKSENSSTGEAPIKELQPADDSEEKAKLAEYEAKEAKRKAEWEEKQREKRAAEQERINEISAMTDEEIEESFAGNLRDQTEKLTRRNMKFYVTAYLQSVGQEDKEFARLTMNPKKSMANCFRYVTRKAFEFLTAESKAKGEEINGPFGDDVPDHLCYQWAQEYFRDFNAEEDKVEEEQYVPAPYTGRGIKKNPTGKKKKEAKPATKEPAVKKQEKKPAVEGQLSLEALSTEGAA